MIVPSHNKQNEFWIYLAVTWWIGSLVGWIAAWIALTPEQTSGGLLTASGIFLFAVSAVLRLPVLTRQHPSTNAEDHFVWLLSGSANVNWLGYLCLNSANLAAVLPAALVGLLIEFWLWNEALRSDCLSSFRKFCRRILDKYSLTLGGYSTEAVATTQSTKPLACTEPNKLATDNSVLTTSASHVANASPTSEFPSNGLSPSCNIEITSAQCESDADRSSGSGRVMRTCEDGLDPAGCRYVAGEIQVDWQPDQRVQQIVVGLVPAFSASPLVEIEVDTPNCSAQLINITPTGIRLQLKRTQAGSTETTTLSWYARQPNGKTEPYTESADSQPQSLA